MLKSDPLQDKDHSGQRASGTAIQRAPISPNLPNNIWIVSYSGQNLNVVKCTIPVLYRLINGS